MEAIVQPLLQWYNQHKRDLPWRNQTNPYYTWISEIMLQQTRVEAVKDYFTRFIACIPTITALAGIDDDVLMKQWEGLGYYSRARNLKKCAKLCVDLHEGKLPNSYAALLALPGIGPYTAGAIASIAFGQPKAAIDGNVLRVVSRLTNNHTDIGSAAYKTEVTQQLEAILPLVQPGNFNQAIMDLGATICIPNGAPRCNICPLANHCKANQWGTAHFLPVKQAKKARKIEQRTIVLLLCNGKILLQKRPNTGLLADLYEFINVPEKLTKKDVSAFLPKIKLDDKSRTSNQIKEDKIMEVIKPKKLPSAKHIFTHLEWHMQGYLVEANAFDFVLGPSQVWVTMEEMDEQYPLPTALKVYKEFLLAMK